MFVITNQLRRDAIDGGHVGPRPLHQLDELSIFWRDTHRLKVCRLAKHGEPMRLVCPLETPLKAFAQLLCLFA